MGALPTIFGIVSVTLCWLPVVGWLGVGIGLGGCGLATLSLTYWYDRPGYKGWAIAGLLMGTSGSALGLAYQIKHANGSLDGMFIETSQLVASGFFGFGSLVFILATATGRKKSGSIWVILSLAALLVAIVPLGFAILTADRAM